MQNTSLLYSDKIEDIHFIREKSGVIVQYASSFSLFRRIYEDSEPAAVFVRSSLVNQNFTDYSKQISCHIYYFSSHQELYKILQNPDNFNDSREADDYGEKERTLVNVSPTFASLAGKSPAMSALRRSIIKIAATDVSVLMLGETGTGKTTIAKAIHELSSRREKPFIHEVISNSNESVVESKLFGVTQGAFTGAVERKGVFEEADGGSLFLDEIGETSPNIQTKLLHVLSEGLIARIGSNKTISVDNRMLFATNANLESKICQGTFREDLFYRINDVTLRIPPLRERLEDIPELAEAYLRRKKFNKKISESALASLQSFSWKGNIRQLEKVLKNAALFYCDGDTIEAKDIRL